MAQHRQGVAELKRSFSLYSSAFEDSCPLAASHFFCFFNAADASVDLRDSNSSFAAVISAANSFSASTSFVSPAKA